MRKYALMLFLLCLHGLARGQTEAYYWFDGQDGKPVRSPMVQGTFSVDASTLADGIHSFHYLVAENNGGISSPVSSYFVKVASNATKSPLTCLCSVDGRQVYQQTLPADGGAIHWDLDMADVADGIHLLQIEALTPEGAICNSYNVYFVKMPEVIHSQKGYYWFDDEKVPQEADVLNGSFEVDVSSLTDGFHRFCYLAAQDEGGITTPSYNYFLKVAPVAEDDSLNCICTVDGQLRHIEKLSQQGGVIHWNLDMYDLTDGIHRIQLQAVTKSGALSNSHNAYFMRVTTSEELKEMRCVYAIDNDTFNNDANIVSNNGSYHFDLDLSELKEGLHYISYVLYNDRGTSTKVETRFFVKTPLGGNGITQYQYWLNDDDISEAKTVTLPQKVNPLQLMSLLPVESRSFRSSLFLFDMSSGQPKVYAKNTIHLRFYDAATRFTDVAKDYADYSVGQDVSIIKELESGVRETTSWPEENEIKWYQVTAERGDSLRFKLDHAATLQLFSPSGKEVYNVSGSESVNWGGLHAAETGTFYVALHDVTATQGDDISIDYEHIDRYAVLRQDVSVVGNGGYSTITFEGNGFDELTSVDLVLGSNVISAVEVGHESNATSSVKFDFSGATLGQYQAVFHFEEGELTVEKCVKVEEATPIELFESVSFASQFLMGTSNSYVYKVHNNGNMTAYNVPMAILIFTPDSLSLSNIEINGYDTKSHLQKLLKEQYTDSLKNIIARKETQSGDLYFFSTADSIDYIDGHPYMHFAYITPTLRPNTTEIYTISVKSTKKVYVYMWIDEDWENDQPAQALSRKKANNDKNCNQLIFESVNCAKWWHLKELGDPSMYDSNCSPPKPSGNCPNPPGGGSTPGFPVDPNDIYGYVAESGSHAVKTGMNEVYYTIEFENDPKIATAAAHEIFVTDTLNATKFDLSTFAPTRLKIGEKEAELTGKKNFVKTIDMRPEINAIAQVEGTFDEQKGIAKWHISSLDPMTMEPTDDVMQGVLPVNHHGNGMGEVMFDISLKPGLEHGTTIDNRAAIVFDRNDVIMTPTWTNIIDRIAPESHVTNVVMANDSTATVSIKATDELSGQWRYNVYVQYGSGAWFLGAENVPVDKTANVRVYEGIDHGFYVVATDSAGNVEQKEAIREYTFEVFESKTDTDTRIELAEGWNWMSHNQQEALPAETLKDKAQRIVGQTEELKKDATTGWQGNLHELLPTQMYKVQMAEPQTVQLGGRLFNAGFRSIPLYGGWNWIGYPLPHTLGVSEALGKLEAEEGDFIIGQDGMTGFNNGNWIGTLTELTPGLGYMYRSASTKNLFYNIGQSSSRRASSIVKVQSSIPEGWTIDKRKYPNIMGIVAELCQGEDRLASGDWLIGAFRGEECRGLSTVVGDVLMMNVYGNGAENIRFYAVNGQTGEVQSIVEVEPLRVDVLGSLSQPYQLHLGSPDTGIATAGAANSGTGDAVYDLQGRRISDGDSQNTLRKGLYIVTDKESTKPQKVIRK